MIEADNNCNIYEAAIAAHTYESPTYKYAPDVEWYLPDVGELTYLLCRLYEVQRSLYLLSDAYDDVVVSLNCNHDYWSST
jgi:hypothetical protein